MNAEWLYPLLLAWMLDLALGDPAWLPHLVVGFGRAISRGERLLNRGKCRRLKGGLLAVGLISSVFLSVAFLLHATARHPFLHFLLSALFIFYGLAGTTLIREVRQVFLAVERSLEEGRQQVARIVGRDTSALSAQEIRTAALETLAENLSDGVVAPLFWLSLFGIPGMMAYKMTNTLDSMIGYRTERYRDFGCVAARIDDIANYLPARLTALLMVVAALFLPPSPAASPSPFKRFGATCRFIKRYGRAHASPNSGYPEAALAGILNCRFGGPHHYFGQIFYKPYIGENNRLLTGKDMTRAIFVNRMAEVIMMLCLCLLACH